MDILTHRKIGVSFHPEPTITVWAPHARKVSIEIEGKESISLHKEEMGYWHAPCPSLEPGDQYLLKINNKNSFPDPASLSQPHGVHKASQCIDLQALKNIHHKPWQGIEVKDLIIYELHTGTFSPEGTFRGIAKKLDYLKDLGINAIKILPIASFPGKRNWGYDGVFPFAVQHSYGGAEEFARLVKSCHEKGIAVILDVVYNHLGPEGNYLETFGPYFTAKYTTPWGKAINMDDAWCDGVRNYFIENAMMWLRDFHVDGLRLDAVHAIRDFGPKHFLRQLSENIDDLNQQTHANHFLIAECDLNDTRYINDLEQDGYGMDSQWCDEWHHSLHAVLTGEKTGYYSDFGSMDQLVKSYNHAFVFTGEYSQHRKKLFGTSTTGQPGDKFVIFTQNHDQVGNRMNGDRLTTLVDFESLKLAVGAMLLSPFVPMLFMGEEYGEENPFLYFINHGDDQLVEAIRKGRKKEFRDFFKNATPPDPAAEDTFYTSKLKWDFKNHPHQNQLLGFYKKLIFIRKKYSLLTPGNRKNFKATLSENKNAIILHHKGTEMDIWSVLNFSQENLKTALPLVKNTGLELLLYSAHQQWGGTIDNDHDPVEKNDQIQIHSAPHSIIIFLSQSIA